MKFGWYDVLIINRGNRILILFFCTAAVCVLENRAYSLTWPLSMQSYRSKRNFLHKKGVQLPQDLFGRPIWLLFLCFGAP